MADTGVVVVPAPSAQQPTIDRSNLVAPNNAIGTGGGGGAATNPPLQPIHETNLHVCRNDNTTIATDGANFDTNLTKQHIDVFTPLDESSLNPELELDKGPALCQEVKKEPHDDFQVANCGGSSQPSQEPPGSALAEETKRVREIEETIIDNFAICAFASWEDLQDEINEKIALDRAEQKNTANEKSSSNKSQPRKRSKPKREKSATNVDGSQESAESQTIASKSKKKVKLDKKPERDRDRHRKSTANGQSSRPSDPSKTTAGTASGKKASNSVNRHATIKEPATEGCSSKSPSNSSNGRPGNSSGEHIGEATKNVIHTHQHAPQQPPPTSQDKKPAGQDLNQDATPSRATPYSPYGSNPHLNRLYDITSQADHPMQRSFYHEPQKQSNSQSQQPNKPNAPPSTMVGPPPNHQAHTKPAQSSHQYQTPYHQAPPPFMAYAQPQPQPQRHQPPPPPPPSATHGSAYQGNHYPTNPAGSYFYPMGAGANGHTSNQQHSTAASGYPPQSGYSSQPAPRNPYHNNYMSGSLFPQHPQQMAQPPNPFSMYPPHLAQPQHSSSVMSSSMSMSAMPSPYGSPYIVTDTTISRQTSIMPTTPSALEQAAASSVASRFGHHPSLIHSMNHCSPSAAAAAAAASAVAASHSHNTSSASLFPSPADRSFMELAKSYSNAHAAPSNYPSFMSHSPALPATQTPSASSTLSSSSSPSSHGISPYAGLDRWPRMSMDYSHERAISRYNSLYNTSAPPLNPYAGYGMRPPSFPAAMFPPPPPPPF